jgi:hypothetical protein
MRFRCGIVLFAAAALAIYGSTMTGFAHPNRADDAKKTEDKKDDKTLSFKDDVMPLLSSACVNCHSGKKKKGGVDLSTYEAVMKSVKAGEPDKSRLVKSVTGQGAKLMPPKKGLADDQVKILRDWIMAGAKND